MITPIRPELTPVLAADDRIAVMLRRDWEFLFGQLKSTHAVVGYINRVAGQELELGDEPMRYYDLATADADTPPGDMEPNLLPPGSRTISAPLLPFAPAATQDTMAHRVIRIVLEDIALGPGSGAGDAERLSVLALMDEIPVGHREQAGRFMLDALEEVEQAPNGETWWRFRRIVARADTQLALGACSTYNEMTGEAFSGWVQLRHHEQQRRLGGQGDLTTVGVILTPRHDGRRPWDTTMIAASGDIGLTDDEVAALSAIFPSGG